MSAKIKLHLNYFFNKVNLFIFLSSLVLILIAILAIVSDLDPNIYSINQYYQSSYLLFSIFSNSFACFLFSFNYLKEQDEYRYLIDNQWFTDPNTPHVFNEFGSATSVLLVASSPVLFFPPFSFPLSPSFLPPFSFSFFAGKSFLFLVYLHNSF